MVWFPRETTDQQWQRLPRTKRGLLILGRSRVVPYEYNTYVGSYNCLAAASFAFHGLGPITNTALARITTKSGGCRELRAAPRRSSPHPRRINRNMSGLRCRLLSRYVGFRAQATKKGLDILSLTATLDIRRGKPKKLLPLPSHAGALFL